MMSASGAPNLDCDASVHSLMPVFLLARLGLVPSPCNFARGLGLAPWTTPGTCFGARVRCQNVLALCRAESFKRKFSRLTKSRGCNKVDAPIDLFGHACCASFTCQIICKLRCRSAAGG